MSTAPSSPLAELSSLPALRDQWVAIDPAGYTCRSQTPLRFPLSSGGVVVDADEDLDVLCRRLKDERRTSLTILFAGH